MYALGIIPSRSRPRVSNDNPYAESLFKTLKYVPNYQSQRFVTLQEVWFWVRNFVEWYNNEHCHNGIHYVMLDERHADLDKEVLVARRVLDEQSREEHPERWSRNVRVWFYVDKEWLNLKQKKEVKASKIKRKESGVG